MALQSDVDDSIEQWVARADERRRRLSLWCYQRFLEGDALIAGHHRLADANQAITVSDRCRHIGYLIAARLALLRGTPQPFECLEEEGLDIVRLQAACIGSFHVLTDT